MTVDRTPNLSTERREIYHWAIAGHDDHSLTLTMDFFRFVEALL